MFNTNVRYLSTDVEFDETKLYPISFELVQAVKTKLEQSVFVPEARCRCLYSHADLLINTHRDNLTVLLAILKAALSCGVQCH